MMRSREEFSKWFNERNDPMGISPDEIYDFFQSPRLEDGIGHAVNTVANIPLSKQAVEYSQMMFPCEPPCDSYGICDHCFQKSIFHAGFNMGFRSTTTPSGQEVREAEKNIIEAVRLFNKKFSPKEVSWATPIDKAEFVFKREFMLMEHNYLCACCKEKSAVQETYTGILQPCWECQKKWKVKKVRFWDKWFQ